MIGSLLCLGSDSNNDNNGNDDDDNHDYEQIRTEALHAYVFIR